MKIGDRVEVKPECVGRSGRNKDSDGGKGTIISQDEQGGWNVKLDKDTDPSRVTYSYAPYELLLEGPKEDTPETYNGYTLKRDITVKELILAGADDEDVRAIDGIVCNRADGWNGECSLYIPIPLAKVIDYASSCNDKLQWLVDKGFVEKVEEKLKPCPFCGGNPSMNGEDIFWLKCRGCGAEKQTFSTKKEAIEDWNKRQ